MKSDRFLTRTFFGLSRWVATNLTTHFGKNPNKSDWFGIN